MLKYQILIWGSIAVLLICTYISWKQAEQCTKKERFDNLDSVKMYSECYFKGDKEYVYKSNIDTVKKTIKSIEVPIGFHIRLFQYPGWKGMQLYPTDLGCIKEKIGSYIVYQSYYDI